MTLKQKFLRWLGIPYFLEITMSVRAVTKLRDGLTEALKNDLGEGDKIIIRDTEDERFSIKVT
jgi:hypothetical protein